MYFVQCMSLCHIGKKMRGVNDIRFVDICQTRACIIDICEYIDYTGHTQKNGAVLIVFTIKTAPFVCVCPVL